MRLTAFRQRVVPVLVGRVDHVSADALVDKETGVSYYEAHVSIPPDQLSRSSATSCSSPACPPRC